jgi:hypothetical protein
MYEYFTVLNDLHNKFHFLTLAFFQERCLITFPTHYVYKALFKQFNFVMQHFIKDETHFTCNSICTKFND